MDDIPADILGPTLGRCLLVLFIYRIQVFVFSFDLSHSSSSSQPTAVVPTIQLGETAANTKSTANDQEGNED